MAALIAGNSPDLIQAMILDGETPQRRASSGGVSFVRCVVDSPAVWRRSSIVPVERGRSPDSLGTIALRIVYRGERLRLIDGIKNNPLDHRQVILRNQTYPADDRTA